MTGTPSAHAKPDTVSDQSDTFKFQCTHTCTHTESCTHYRRGARGPVSMLGESSRLLKVSTIGFPVVIRLALSSPISAKLYSCVLEGAWGYSYPCGKHTAAAVT